MVVGATRSRRLSGFARYLSQDTRLGGRVRRRESSEPEGPEPGRWMPGTNQHAAAGVLLARVAFARPQPCHGDPSHARTVQAPAPLRRRRLLFQGVPSLRCPRTTPTPRRTASTTTTSRRRTTCCHPCPLPLPSR